MLKLLSEFFETCQNVLIITEIFEPPSGCLCCIDLYRRTGSCYLRSVIGVEMGHKWRQNLFMKKIDTNVFAVITKVYYFNKNIPIMYKSSL